MTFNEAVKVIEDFTAEILGENLGLLDGLEFIQNDISYCAENEGAWKLVTPELESAYHVVCREMRKIFF